MEHYNPATACEKDQNGTSWFCSQAISKPVWHIPLLCVQWKTPDDGQRNCPKHVEFRSKNKFGKLVHLVGFTVRNWTRWTVTWTSKYNMCIYICRIISKHIVKCKKYILIRLHVSVNRLTIIYLLVPISRVENPWLLKMEPKRCPKTPVINYHYAPINSS
jgi:hypothetical protein